MEHLSLEIFDLPTAENPNPTGSQYAYLPEDATITIVDTSEVFASGDVWSYSFTLNTVANAHIFGSAGDVHGARLHEQINKRRARLWVEGLPMYLGYLKLGDEVDVDADGDVEVSFESGQKTFEDLIDGAKANQVPTIGDVEIGMALWRKRWTFCEVKLQATGMFTSGGSTDTVDVDALTHTDISFSGDGEADDQSTQQYPRMVFPTGTFATGRIQVPGTVSSGGQRDGSGSGGGSGGAYTVSCINTDFPYTEDEDGTPTYPYCNVALCYQKYGYTQKQKDGTEKTDYGTEPVAQRGYEYMPADRVNSAPNFFVIYWIRCLMNHLGIHIDENQMMDVEDLRRLFFVNTNCDYIEPKTLRTGTVDERFGAYHFQFSGNNIRRLVPEYFGKREVDKSHDIEYVSYNRKDNIDMEESGIEGSTYTIGEPQYNHDALKGHTIPTIDKISITIKDIGKWNSMNKERYEQVNGNLHKAIATSKCFPNTDISDVIHAVENGFGVRFLFSDNYKRVRIVLLRNIFRSDEVQDIVCDVEDADEKVENSIRGFRMTYGSSEDTTFYYKGFADKLPHKKKIWVDDSDKHDYSHWKLDADYGSIIGKISAFDKTCYVTPATGNAYGIKIDKDAKRYQELHPSLFEYAGYMDAEDGDCTGDENTIQEINVGFVPAIMNDLNMEAERNAKTEDDKRQKFALFVDETMRPRRPDLEDGVDYNDPETEYFVSEVPSGEWWERKCLYDKDSETANMTAGDGIIQPGSFSIRSDMSGTAENLEATLVYKIGVLEHTQQGYIVREYPVKWKVSNLTISGWVNEGYRLYLQDNYEPNDEGISPIEKHDWGLTLGIMRGSGSDGYLNWMVDPDDNEGNDTWEVVSGSSVTAHPDTCDSYGNLWDYNGVEEDDYEGRFSLKLRAEKPNPEFDPKKEETHYDPQHPEANTNPRYLSIDNEKLRQRGLCDQFYKEYSYWVRNARIVRRTVRMELSQLLAIDKTKKVKVGDVTGFIRKRQVSVSNKTGLGLVTMEIMYI